MTELVIRWARAVDLPVLTSAPWTAGLPEKHGERLGRQEHGDAAYLLAVLDGCIVGHLLLKWDGPCGAPLRSTLPPCAEIEDFVVAPEHRSRGIGAGLLAHAARITADRGLTRLGLGVGVDNHRARTLYERSGFMIQDVPEFDVRWQYRTPDGEMAWGSERCLYMVKPLG